MKCAQFLAVISLLLGIANLAAAATYNCLPVEILDQPDYFRVQCAEPSVWEGGYPRDGADRIQFFGVPKSDSGFAKRFAYIAQTALTAGMIVQFQYTSGDLSSTAFGCASSACRKPSAFGLLAPGTDVRIPYVVWPGSTSESIAQGKWKIYGPFSISSFRKLAVNMTGTGNADLYVRRDDPPTDTQYTCRPKLGASAESVAIAGPDATVERGVTYYVGVKGSGATNTYKLSVAIQNKPPGTPPGGC